MEAAEAWGKVPLGNSDVGRDVGVDRPSRYNEPETSYLG